MTRCAARRRRPAPNLPCVHPRGHCHWPCRALDCRPSICTRAPPQVTDDDLDYVFEKCDADKSASIDFEEAGPAVAKWMEIIKNKVRSDEAPLPGWAAPRLCSSLAVLLPGAPARRAGPPLTPRLIVALESRDCAATTQVQCVRGALSHSSHHKTERHPDPLFHLPCSEVCLNLSPRPAIYKR